MNNLFTFVQEEEVNEEEIEVDVVGVEGVEAEEKEQTPAIEVAQ